MSRATPPRALTVAGSDSGGGAGIQADLKTFAAHGVYGTSAITAITAQNTVAVTAVHPVPPEIVAAQIDAVCSDIGVDAVKIGMLGDEALIRVVAEALDRWTGPPIVVDPVMVAKSGARLLAPEAVAALSRWLIPRAALLTPNVPEAEALLGRTLGTLEERIAGARELSRRGPAVLLKGGHASGAEVEDVLVVSGRAIVHRHSRVDTVADHGTGCTLSSAIAARLARGESLNAAVEGAIDYLQEALSAAPRGLGRGRGPVGHFHAGVEA